jgi:hypothetical protein
MTTAQRAPSATNGHKPTGVAEFVAAIQSMAYEVAGARLRAETAEANLANAERRAEIAEHELFRVNSEELTQLRNDHDELAKMRADLVEINRCLNYYGGYRGWCSEYEHLISLVNDRLTSGVKLCGRPGEDAGGVAVLPNDADWKPLEWN